jgi:hypothetical protein
LTCALHCGIIGDVSKEQPEEHQMSWTYRAVPASEVPDSIVFTTPARNTGQIVEVSYSRGIPAGRARDMEAGDGDPWMRVTDRSDRSVTFYRRDGRA